jgi:hypothetical protein
MFELAVIISPKGVVKTRICAAELDLDEALRLYKQIAPTLQTIDDVLIDVGADEGDRRQIRDV